MTHKVLGLIDLPNKMLQAEHTDVITAVQLIKSASVCFENLRSEEEFVKLWTDGSGDYQVPAPPKRQYQAPKALQHYVVGETVGQQEQNLEQE